MRSPGTARLALGFLCASALLIGLTATIDPAAFYDDFPFVAHWVDLLPPYNEHLVTDVGGLYLGFHARHLDGFSTADAIAELASLALLIGAPAVALWASGALGGTGAGSSRSAQP